MQLPHYENVTLDTDDPKAHDYYNTINTCLSVTVNRALQNYISEIAADFIQFQIQEMSRYFWDNFPAYDRCYYLYMMPAFKQFVTPGDDATLYTAQEVPFHKGVFTQINAIIDDGSFKNLSESDKNLLSLMTFFMDAYIKTVLHTMELLDVDEAQFLQILKDQSGVCSQKAPSFTTH